MGAEGEMLERWLKMAEEVYSVLDPLPNHTSATCRSREGLEWASEQNPALSGSPAQSRGLWNRQSHKPAGQLL